MAVGADSYTEPDRQKPIFAADLIGKAGVVPIHVLVQNLGPRPMKLRRSEITLEFPDGIRLTPINAGQVVRNLMGPPGAKSISFWALVEGSTDLAKDILLTVFLAPIWTPIVIGITMHDSAKAKEREARLADYQGKGLQDTTLETNATVHGFVYFGLLGLRIDDATLVIRLADAEDESRLTDLRLRLGRVIPPCQ